MFLGLKIYLDTMKWKVFCFLKMTFGVWDGSLLENMQIKCRSSRFGIAHEASFDTRHESMLMTTGEAHTLVWLFFPYCAFLTKAGEYFNASPVFVYDDAVKSAIAMA